MFSQINRELRWNELQPEERAKALLVLQCPFLCKLLSDIDRLNEGIGQAGTRRYLSHLLVRGEIQLTSPFTGKGISSGSSFTTKEKHCILSFVDDPSVFVVISDLGAGFPISSIILSRGATLLHLTSTPWVIALSRLQCIDCCMFSPVSAASLSIVVGDANFAHHAWNQLPAICDLLNEGILSNICTIIATHEPLGPIQAIFPELPISSVVRVPDSYLEKQNKPGLLIVPVGSRVLTEEVVRRIHRAAASGSDVTARPHSLAGTPILWLSVRTRDRTPMNQVDLLATVGKTFLNSFPNSRLIIDGHSLPMDASDEEVYRIPMILSTVSNDQRVAIAVEEGIRLLSGDLMHGRIINAVGLPILESIVLASTATFYFCHHGTVQHKIGWFTSCRGIVHSNRKVIAMMPEEWVTAQSTVSVRPIYLDEDFVVDVPCRSEDAATSSLLLGNYVVLKCDAVAQFVTLKAQELASP